MGVFQQFPYSNFHEMNMDEIIKIVKNMLEEWARYHAEWDAWMDEINADWSNYQNVMNAAWQNMQNFINNYFDNLDVQNEINNKITSMVNSGEFASIVEPYIPPRVTAWLTEHITEPVGVVIDTSLSVSGACADAKATGDAINNLKENFAFYGSLIHDPDTNYIDMTKTIHGYRISSDTGLAVTQGASELNASDFIPVTEGSTFYRGTGVYIHYYGYYDANKSYMSSIVDYEESLGNPFTIPEGVSFMRVTITDEYIQNAWISPTNSKPADYALMLVPSETFENNVSLIINNTDWDNVVPTASHNPHTNYIDMSKVTSGYVNENGYYVSNPTLKCTDFIPLEEGRTYYRGAGIYGGKYYGFYDADKNVIGSGEALGKLTQAFTVPEGAVYGRFTILEDATINNTWIFIQNSKPGAYALEYSFGDHMSEAVLNAINDVKPTNYEGMDIQAFNTCVCIGDSLTEGIFNYTENNENHYESIPEMSYPSALQRITGITVSNKGESGTTSAEWYTNHSNDDLSGNKFAIIQFGVNDVVRYGQSWTNTSSEAYSNIINKLKTDNPQIKIFVSTVMPAVSFQPSNYIAYNAGLISYIESLNDANVILLDLALYGNTEPTQYNAGHLSAYGYWRLAKDYTNYISWYMNKNGLQFREIQFIGTNRHY